MSAGTIMKKIQTLQDTIESLRQQLVFTRTEEEEGGVQKKTKEAKEPKEKKNNCFSNSRKTKENTKKRRRRKRQDPDAVDRTSRFYYMCWIEGTIWSFHPMRKSVRLQVHFVSN
jgi:vesicle coat complex subunit